MTLRALTFLNERGDTTLVWTADRDHEMESVVEKKMAEGVIFYLIDPRFGTRETLRDVGDITRHRMLAIPDADFAKFVGMATVGAPSPESSTPTAGVVETPRAPAKGARRAKSAKEVASGESVAVRPRRGG